jgi:hypothetical protein
MALRDGWQVRVVAGLTTAYSVAITVSPKLLAKPCGLTAPGGSVPTDIASLTRSIGTRDASLALALLVAPTGRSMRVLTAARVVSDAADAAWFGRMVTRDRVAKIAGAAGGWAVLELLALLAAERA